MSNASTHQISTARKLLPILDWIPAYRREWFLPDTLAGVALWAVMVPEGMAYAGIVGVPPIMGLYTLVPALLAYALLGTSRQLVVGPDTATGLISAVTVGAIATQGTVEFNTLTLAVLIARRTDVGRAAGHRLRRSLGSFDLDIPDKPSAGCGARSTPGYRSLSRRHTEATTFPGLLIWRVGGDLYFASIGHVSEALEAALVARPEVKRVLLDCSQVNFIDISASDELLRRIKELQSRGITLALARVRDAVRDDMRLDGIEAIVGAQNFYERITDGVRALKF